MFLRQNVLFAVVLLWNLTESAFDNDNKTHVDAHDNSSSSRLTENPLDGHSFSELQESAPVNETNRVDQLNETRGPTAHVSVLRQMHPKAMFNALHLDKYITGPLDFKTATGLRSWMGYAGTYDKHGQKGRWYTTRKVFFMLVKTRPVNEVLRLFWYGNKQEEARMLQTMLAEPGFSALRKSMNQQWLKSGTRPETVFWLLGVGKKFIAKDPDAFHWIWYCDRFRQKYGDAAFPAVEIVKSLREKDTLGNPLLYGAYFQRIKHDAKELRFLTDEMEEVLYDWMIKVEEITPLSAYSSLQASMEADLLGLEKTDRRLCALKAFTLASTRSIGEYLAMKDAFENKPREVILGLLYLISKPLPELW
uniref:RXLR phytopathogen effector protein WY-domain domain-containing protein n=1 Tax=Peronospora matthiolae TaxID=2874970 RepID=A0AAV1U0P3_9STRA